MSNAFDIIYARNMKVVNAFQVDFFNKQFDASLQMQANCSFSI